MTSISIATDCICDITFLGTSSSEVPQSLNTNVGKNITMHVSGIMWNVDPTV